MFSTFNRLRHFEGKPTLANANRTHFRHSEWKGIRSKVILQTTLGGLAFILWFLGCLSYLYGTLYLSPQRHANFHVLAVDYDGGVVGQSLQAAYKQLRGPGFFTVDFRPASEFPTQEDLYQAVWRGDYWASIAATANASDRLGAALQGGPAASTYNPQNALHYTWNQQYYTTFANSIVLGHMNQLVAATRLAYNHLNGTQASAALNTTSSSAVSALLNPIQASVTNIQPATFGAVILLNTVSMAMPVMQQFFFLLVLNGVLGAHNLYRKMTVLSSLRFRRLAGLLFTLGASLAQTGYYWAFKEDWAVDGAQFALTWMTFWLLMHIHLLILDSISTVAPLPVMPFVVLLWVLLNIASTLSPLEVQPAFYRWHDALPSHAAYSVLMTIWAHGAHSRLYRSLPILFSWWVLANLTTSLTHIVACHRAFKLEGGGGDLETNKVEGDEKQEQAAPELEEGGLENSISRTTTVGRMARQRTREEVVRDQRVVYGPSIPPLA